MRNRNTEPGTIAFCLSDSRCSVESYQLLHQKSAYLRVSLPSRSGVCGQEHERIRSGSGSLPVVNQRNSRDFSGLWHAHGRWIVLMQHVRSSGVNGFDAPNTYRPGSRPRRRTGFAELVAMASSLSRRQATGTEFQRCSRRRRLPGDGCLPSEGPTSRTRRRVRPRVSGRVKPRIAI